MVVVAVAVVFAVAVAVGVVVVVVFAVAVVAGVVFAVAVAVGVGVVVAVGVAVAVAVVSACLMTDEERVDLDTIKARLAAVYAAGASGITARLADHGIRVIVQMQSWEGNTAHEAKAAVTHLLGHAPADLTALVEEVERLREHRESCTKNLLKGYETGKAEERAAVVAWLRRKATHDFCALRVKEACDAEKSADAIERGEHRRKEAK